MRACLIILSILVLSSCALAKDFSNNTHHCCTTASHGPKNVTLVGPLADKGMPERTRRSAQGDRGQRAQFSKALFDTSSKEFLPARGRRSKLNKLLEMSSAENPFWAARGRRAFASSAEDPFWAARGKKLIALNSLEKDDPFWAARGKKLLESSMEKDDPFWAARGKKLLLEASAENPFWAARGKKLLEASGEDPFWAARGKKLQRTSAEDPFWAARGKKEASAENPFWAARGKKEASAENPFWAARGKRPEKSREASASGSKENPFWAARGKRQDPKLEGSREVGGIIKPRANRQQGEEFWPARGKRPLLPHTSPSLMHFWQGQPTNSDDDEANEEDDTFWARLFGLLQDDDAVEDEEMPEMVAHILGIKPQKTKKEMLPERTVPIVNPWYSTDFWATRG